MQITIDTEDFPNVDFLMFLDELSPMSRGQLVRRLSEFIGDEAYILGCHLDVDEVYDPDSPGRREELRLEHAASLLNKAFEALCPPPPDMEGNNRAISPEQGENHDDQGAQ